MGLLGSASIYVLLNVMSESGIDAYRVVSVLGYCLLPMVGVGALSVMVTLEWVYLALSRRNYSYFPLQRYAGLHVVNAIRSMVHMVCIEYFRSRAPHVRSETTRRLSGRTAVYLFRSPQCLQCGVKVNHAGLKTYTSMLRTFLPLIISRL